MITSTIVKSYLLARGWEALPEDTNRLRPGGPEGKSVSIFLSDAGDNLEWTLHDLAAQEQRPVHSLAESLGLCVAAGKCYSRALACRIYLADVSTPEDLRSLYRSVEFELRAMGDELLLEAGVAPSKWLDRPGPAEGTDPPPAR